ncbi:hypothetical protein HDU83_005433 [Entophlyctis luteolus]|nr:hypothetical protein HDU83_005433 [Entophlyctis luteolus]
MDVNARIARARSSKGTKLTAKQYVAVSHVWGNASPHDDVENRLCGGITITCSMDKIAAARAYANAAKCSLWMDVLCIDQRSPQDQSAQVSLMGDLYKQCRECLVLLTEEDGIALKQVVKDVTDVAKFWERWEGITEFDSGTARQILSEAAELYRAAQRLEGQAKTDIKHFTRVWTLQEVVLPERVVFATYKGGTATVIEGIDMLAGVTTRTKDSYLRISEVLIKRWGSYGLQLHDFEWLRLAGYAAYNSSHAWTIDAAVTGSVDEQTWGTERLRRVAIYDNYRFCSREHDIIYATMYLLGIKFEVDYKSHFQDALAKVAPELIKNGIMHVAHLKGLRDRKIAGQAYAWSRRRNSMCWLGDDRYVYGQKSFSMGQINRRWLDDIPHANIGVRPEFVLSRGVMYTAGWECGGKWCECNKIDVPQNIRQLLEAEPAAVSHGCIWEQTASVRTMDLAPAVTMYESLNEMGNVVGAFINMHGTVIFASVATTDDIAMPSDRLVLVGHTVLAISKDGKYVKHRYHWRQQGQPKVDEQMARKIAGVFETWSEIKLALN